MDKNKTTEWFGSAAVIAPDEPSNTSWYSIALVVIAFSFFIAIPIITYLLVKPKIEQENRTIQQNNHSAIHDTIMIRDTIRIEQTPVTFICHGICNGIEDFSRD